MNTLKKILLFALTLALALHAHAAGPTSQPAAGEFTLVARDTTSMRSWGDFVDIQLGGPANPDWLNASKWTLRINGVPVGIDRIYPAAEAGHYRFAIIRPAAKPTGPGELDSVAINALAPDRFGSADAAISLEFAGQPLKPLGTAPALVLFGLVHPFRLIAFAIIALIVVVGVWFTGWKTGVLRDDEPTLAPTDRPFSLARVQLALWMVLIGISFILLYLITGQTNGILNGTAVALLGISSVTTLASAAAGDPKPAAPAPVVAAVAVPPQRHVGLVDDLISDTKGANLHRVQMVMWTLVLAAIYVFDTWTSLKLPNFDPQTFALMGISSTTYVWFKNRE